MRIHVRQPLGYSIFRRGLSEHFDILLDYCIILAFEWAWAAPKVLGQKMKMKMKVEPMRAAFLRG